METEKFEAENDAYKAAELDCAAIWSKYVPVLNFLPISLPLCLMFYGGIMAIRGEISLGSLVTVNGYLWMLNMPLRMAGWFVNDVQRFCDLRGKNPHYLFRGAP